MSLRNKLAKEFARYSTGFIFQQFLTIALAVYIRNVLGPEQMGVWVALQVILKYTKYTNLGLAGAASREIPYARGQGETEKATHIRNASFSFTLAGAVVLALVIFVAAFFVRPRFGDMVFYSLITLSFLSVFQRVSTFCISMVRAEKQFQFMNRFNVYSSLANAALTVVLITYFKLYGYYASMVLSFLFNMVFIMALSGVRFRWEWDPKQVMALSKMGIPLIVINVLNTFLDSVDKISISAFLGLKELGVYSVAFMASSFIITIPNNLGMILFPYQNEAYGADKNSETVKKFAVTPNLFLAMYMPVIISFFWLASPLVVAWLMPDYVAGVFPLKICLFGTLFMMLCSNMSNTLITFKKYLWMIPLQAIVGGAIFGANFILAKKLGAGIAGIAWMELAGYLVLYLWYSAIAFKVLEDKMLFWTHTVKAVGYVVYFLALLLMLDRVVPESGWQSFGVRAAVILLASIPVLWKGEKKFKTMGMLLHVAKPAA